MSAWLSRLCVSVGSVCAPRVTYTGHCPGLLIRSRVLSPRSHVFHHFSTNPIQIIKYEELKGLLKERSVVLIDVRELWEVKQYGAIPGAINIPQGDIVPALQMSPKDFEEKYQTQMPVKSDNLVFSCLAGVRSRRAMGTAISLGYSRVQDYSGGFQDWTAHEFPDKKR
ncbi:thiosulfate sulfurtransferase/rhodanese-like domain-containing protein 3 [Ascaphus truei]|uniref:thiosulfate sulfurtransferase/rhodanese-like domain-containing protein 3 n=1 Tax=Ascaphus truei TaxID=8439 RepID=UPI003F5A2F80